MSLFKILSRTLRGRLLVAGVLSVVFALAMVGAGVLLLLEHYAQRRVDRQLDVHLKQIASNLKRNDSGEIVLAQKPVEPRFERPMSGLYWQVAVQPGGPKWRSRSVWDDEIKLPPEMPKEGRIGRHWVRGPNGETLYLVERLIVLPLRSGSASVRATVALDAAEIRRSVPNFVVEIAPYLLVLGAVLMFAAWVQIAVGLRPLRRVHRRLEEIGSGRARRLGSNFPAEIMPLAIRIDALLDARDVQIRKAQARAADLAHGLKTPLAALAGDIQRLHERGDADLAAKIANLVSTMDAQIKHHLVRERIKHGLAYARANIRHVAECVITVVRRTPDGQNRAWQVDIPEDLEARVHETDLMEMLGNLIDNAARHARTRVVVSGRADNGHVAVTIADDGPGIPADRLAEALSRGGRLDTSRPGTGLGLAIVSEIAEAWEVHFAIEDAEPGVRAVLGFRLASSERRAANGEQRTASDERRIASDERRIANDERRIANDERRIASGER